MTSLASKLAPDSIKKLIPYQSARRIGGSGRLWLNANELEHGVHYSEHASDYNRYPDFLPHDIAAAYQEYCQTQVPAVAVRGADEAIDLLIRTFCQPGKDKILISSPTYAMYEFCADALAIETIDIPLKGESFDLDVEGVIKQAPQAKIVFLCSPNNPTGNLLSRSDIIAVLEGTQQDAIVVVDEAYIEFELAETVANLIEQYPNLVVIRTLSKAFGLAAVRCGFILAAEEVMEYVMKLIPPYPMPDCSAKIVLDALSPQGIDIAMSNTHSIIETRQHFVEAIQDLQWIEHVYPSSTNFVLIRTHQDAELFSYLKEQGVVTRNQSHEPALKNCVRITIGSPESMQEVAELINQYSFSSL
ncbi:histidinol-phosphate transaminase [Vibrio breoganii]|uniref:histidinol-phosphate transaminase n=1 Tax=Vibrio breoganii TaxID=553239 RepID=UPI0003065565|nr:histidinol-phosphate transaminase [Vibrio breoganii]OED96676.1 histidinol-phosphate transaminase [Vibrio breoganii ZF-29]OEF82940.1 histidinol-phosphate transaminase [Vibrio breoganii 1C10]PMG88144.1 histidinol-phosphate transaminase [Vibrio breoganii]PMK51120.1 histidinol-phosphate transaminase [Vibrio breoganii]PMK77117.1 histidinol-phosphate transaminase [Vibrio breoganii]